MNLEPIGIATILIGLLMFALPLRAAAMVFVCACLFGAAAAMTLPALGGSNITPGHLMLGFFVAVIALRSRDMKGLRRFEALDVGSSGFWLMATAVWCLFGAYVMPRLMQGGTMIFTVERTTSTFGQTTSQVLLRPLAPTSGNFTQSVYFFADFACFTVASFYLRIPGARRWLGTAFLVACVANVAFGFLDLVTYWTGTADYLAFMRNSTYRILDDAEIGGLKRIVGSFPEASTFAGVSVSFFAYSFSLWRRGVHTTISGLAAAASLVLVLMATSSTGYAALGAYFAIAYGAVVLEAWSGGVSRQTMTALLVGPALLVGVAAYLVFNENAMDAVQLVFDKTMSSEKLSSQSGMERANWNAQALENFVDTWGLGVGIGSTRASSVIAVALGSLGFPGVLTYGLFLWQVTRMRIERKTVGDAYRYAAREAAVATVIPAIVSGGQVDLGLLFFLLAALACPPGALVASPRRALVPVANAYPVRWQSRSQGAFQ